jgi:hypothetical protein
MLVAAVIVAVLGFLLKLISAETGGWFLVPLAGAAGIFHVYVHAKAADSPNPSGRIAALSNVFLLGAMLLQIDFGGGNCGWDTLTGVAWRLGMSNDMGCVPLNGVPAILLDIAFYIPAAVTWWKLRADANVTARS